MGASFESLPIELRLTILSLHRYEAWLGKIERFQQLYSAMIRRRRVYVHRNRMTVWFNPTQTREIYLSVKLTNTRSFYDMPFRVSPTLADTLGLGPHSSLSWMEVMGQLYKLRDEDPLRLAPLTGLTGGQADEIAFQRVCQRHLKARDRFFHRESPIFFGYWTRCVAQGVSIKPCHRARMTWERTRNNDAWLRPDRSFKGDASCILSRFACPS